MSDSYHKPSAKDRLGQRAPDRQLYKPGPKRNHYPNHDNRASSPTGYRPTNRDVREANSYDDSTHNHRDMFGDTESQGSTRSLRSSSSRKYGSDSEGSHTHSKYNSRGDDHSRSTSRTSRGYKKDRHGDGNKPIYKPGKTHAYKARGGARSDDLLRVKKPIEKSRGRGQHKSPFSNVSRGTSSNTFSRGARGGRGHFSGFRGKFGGSAGYNQRNKNLPPIDDDELKNYLSTCWNDDLKMIDLTAVKTDDRWAGQMRKFDLEHKPDLTALAEVIKSKLAGHDSIKINMSKNGLRYCNQFEPLKNLENLTFLDLSRNQFEVSIIADFRTTLGKWDSLQEMNLLENPIMENYDIHEISARLRRDGLFKNLVKLNGVVLPKVAGFGDIQTLQEIETAKGLPENPEKMCINSEIAENANNLILPFIEELITRFDTTKRVDTDVENPDRVAKSAPLYDEDAVLSLIINSGRAKNETADNADHLFKYGRNLNNKSIQKINLFSGKAKILEILNKLPDFKHKSYGIVDLPFADPAFGLIHISYNGLIYEKLSSTRSVIRRISRSLVLSPTRLSPEAEKAGQAPEIPITIINDIITLKAEPDSINKFDPSSRLAAAATTAEVNTVAVAEEAKQAASTELLQAMALLDPKMAAKMQLLQNFVKTTNLDQVKAREFLEAAEWNYDLAGHNFLSWQQQMSGQVGSQPQLRLDSSMGM